MRILHIIGTLDPAAGGPSALVRTMALSAPPDVAFEAVTEDAPGASFLAGVPFPVHTFGSAPRRWFPPGMLPWLRANRDRFDGVLVHGLWEYGCLAARLAFAGRRPVLVFPHGMLDPYFARAHRARHLRKQLYWWLIAFWNLRSATYVLFTTAIERKLARHTFFPARWRAATTPLGCDPAPPDTELLRQAFFDHCPSLQGGVRFLLFLGRVDPKKGCEMLVQAFAAVAPSTPKLHLVIAGPDSNGYTGELQQLAAAADLTGQIHFPGMLQANAKWGALAACDAFLLPSHQENFGIAVIEALASGRAALLSDQVNTAAEIVAFGAGIAEPDTTAGTANLLRQWLAFSAGERSAMNLRALQLYEDRFTMRSNITEILRLFAPSPVSSITSVHAQRSTTP